MQSVRYIAFYGFIFSCSCLANESGEEVSSSPGVFSGYPGESIWTLVWFVVLLLALKKFAWKPLLASLKAREEHICDEIAKAEQTRKAAYEKLAEYERKLAQVHQENQVLLEKQLSESRQKGNEIINDARKEAEQIHVRAKEDINRAIETAKKQLWNDVGDIVCTLGGEILSKNITPEDNRKLIDESIEKFNQLENDHRD